MRNFQGFYRKAAVLICEDSELIRRSNKRTKEDGNFYLFINFFFSISKSVIFSYKSLNVLRDLEKTFFRSLIIFNDSGANLMF